MGYPESAYWLDVGTPQTFVRGSCDLVLGRLPTPALPGPTGPALLLAGASVAAGRVGVRRHRGGRGRLRGRRAPPWTAACCSTPPTVGEGAVVRDSIVGRGAVVAPGAVLDDAVIGDGAFVGPGNELARGIRIWPGVRLEPTSVRFSSDV